MDKSPYYYIAYGSNLNYQLMKARCPSATIIGKSILNGYRLAFKGSADNYAYLTIEESECSNIPIVIYRINPEDEIYLDTYECYPDLYKKEQLTVPFNNTELKGTVYIMHPYLDYHLPSQDYCIICKEGYKLFGFNLSPLQNALQITKDNIQKKLDKRINKNTSE